MPTAPIFAPVPPIRRRRALLVALLLAVVLATTACPGNVSHTYRSFQSAVDRGASCAELFDQRARFSNEDTLSRVDSELDRIGCSSRESDRGDR